MTLWGYDVMSGSRKTAQNNFSFAEAKKAAIDRLSIIATFAENLENITPNRGFLQWAIELRTLQEKVDRSTGRCLTDDEIRVVYAFGKALVRYRPDFQPKLEALWNLFHDIFSDLKLQRSVTSYEPLGNITKLIKRIERADEFAEKLVKEVITDTSSIRSGTSLLTAHVKRVESIEYAIRRQLEDAVETFHLQGEYDVVDICSVQFKVQRTVRGAINWVTDSRAIRDAISHDHWEIIKDNNNDWSIQFDNTEKGYNFHKTFTRKEFHRFFDDFSMLFKLHIHLMYTLEVLPLLSTHLALSQPSL
jgi:hypothetical protein